MPSYEFRCKGHATASVFNTKCEQPPAPSCPQCGATMKRKFTVFAFKEPMPEHFNDSVGEYVTNERSFKDALKHKSDGMSERLGMDVNYQPIDWQDRKSLGVTDEGIEHLV